MKYTTRSMTAWKLRRCPPQSANQGNFMQSYLAPRYTSQEASYGSTRILPNGTGETIVFTEKGLACHLHLHVYGKEKYYERSGSAVTAVRSDPS